MLKKRIEALAAEVEALRSELSEIATAEEPSAEQITRSDVILADFDAKSAELVSLREKQEKIERAMASPALRSSGFGGGPEVMLKRDPFENLESIRWSSEADVKARAATAIEGVQYAGFAISDENREDVTRMIERVPGVAAHALIHGDPAYMRAFQAWLTSGGMPVLAQDEVLAVRAALSLTSANGGYTLPTLLDPTLIKTGALTKNPIRRIARVVSGTLNVWNGVTAANVTTAWKSEGSAFTDGTPTVGAVSVTAAALTAYVTASYEIFQDSSLQGQLPGLIGEAIDQAEGVAFVSGSGSGAPKGIITAVSGTAGSLVTATTRGSFTSASIVDTLAVLNAIPVRYEDSATWVMNKATYRTVEQQMVGTGYVKVVEMADRNQLLGSPVVRSSSVTSTTTSGNILAVFGDFSQFIVYDRIGVSLEFIPNVVDGSGIPTGQRGLVAFKRVGSDVSDVNAFRLLKA